MLTVYEAIMVVLAVLVYHIALIKLVILLIRHYNKKK